MWQLHQDFTTLDSVENKRPSSPPRAVPGFGPCPAPAVPARPCPGLLIAAGDAPGADGADDPRGARRHLAARQHGPRIPRRAGARGPRPPSPRGRRPARAAGSAVYEATGVDAASAFEYAGLASALAAAIHRTSSSPTDDAVTAGRSGATSSHAPRVPDRRPVRSRLDARWSPCSTRSACTAGRRPQLDGPAHPLPAAGGRPQVPRYRLRRTPRPAQGALEEYGADFDGTELPPFAERRPPAAPDAAAPMSTITRPRSLRSLSAPFVPWLVLLAPAGIALLAGLDVALMLLGLPAPVRVDRLPEVHGMLMVLGFVGTLIARNGQSPCASHVVSPRPACWAWAPWSCSRPRPWWLAAAS